MKNRLSPMVWVSFAMVVGVMATALISPLYGLYQQAWQLKTSDVSLIYTIYIIGALCSLLFLAPLTDRIGFLPVLKWGLGLALGGTLMSLLAWDMVSLGCGRFIVGVASGLVTTSSTAGMAKLSQGVPAQRLAVLTSLIMVAGFGVGPLLGGVAGQWFPQPLHSAYILPLVLGVIAFAALLRLRLPDAVPAVRTPFNWRQLLPHLVWPSGPASTAFMLTCTLSFLAFGVFGFCAALLPLFLEKLVPWHGPFVSGAAIALILFASALLQMLVGRMPSHVCGALGLLTLALSCAVLMVNYRQGSALLFILMVVLVAVGHAMTTLTGMVMVNRLAGAANRAGLLASFFVIGYIGGIAPLMGVGWVADHWGMLAGVYAFGALVIVLGGCAALLLYRHPLIRTAPTTAGH